MSRKSGIRRERTVFEWSVLAVSLAAILTILGGLIAYSVSFEGTPPELSVEIEPQSGGFLLTVANRGGTTAEEVVVEVKRGSTSTDVEFRAVPKGDEEQATLELGGSGRPTARLRSFKEP